jgi:hypothetical protein
MSRSLLRPFHWGVALGVVILLWVFGRYLFPSAHVMVLSAILVLIFVVWLVDTSVQVVRQRRSARRLRSDRDRSTGGR